MRIPLPHPHNAEDPQFLRFLIRYRFHIKESSKFLFRFRYLIYSCGKGIQSHMCEYNSVESCKGTFSVSGSTAGISMEQVIAQVAQTVEKKLDQELERLDALDSGDLEAIRQARIAEMKQRAKKKQEWLANGHGEYTEVDNEKDFFTVCNKSEHVVCHFYKNDTPRCKIVDMHLKILAKKHVETRFVKIDAERAPFLTGRLKIRVIPTIACVKDNKMKDFIVGFTDLGNRDDFSTEMLESEVIEYSGDLAVPPAEQRKQRALQIESKRTIRGRKDDSDSDLDLSD
ncbi:thioredoxin domain-containing protein [Phthorimaea operculella]|nr:thioredoxin domain-containing protein [Phthorimaea operculella]